MSMPVIWKFELKIQAVQDVQMPCRAKILCVQKQGWGLYMWARVDPGMPTETRSFSIVGTGHPHESVGLEYLSTVHDEFFVWHVFERMLR